MNTLLKKLNFKNQKHIFIQNAPPEFHEMMREFGMFLNVIEETESEPIEGVLLFVKKQEEIELLGPKVEKSLVEDGLLWFAYPKKSSKKYRCDFDRDSGWQVLGDLGYEPVRIVAVDQDWSALRFRKAKNIKKITRDPSWIMSAEGQKKAKK